MKLNTKQRIDIYKKAISHYETTQSKFIGFCFVMEYCHSGDYMDHELTVCWRNVLGIDQSPSIEDQLPELYFQGHPETCGYSLCINTKEYFDAINERIEKLNNAIKLAENEHNKIP